MENIDSMDVESARELSRVSAYWEKIAPIMHFCPDIMDSNDQVRPLWESWKGRTSRDLPPRTYFKREDLRVLEAFFEHIYFSTDAFHREAER